MELLVETDVKEFIHKLPELSIIPPSIHLVMLAIRSRKARVLMGVKVKDLVVEKKIIRPFLPVEGEETRDWRTKYFNAVQNLALLQQNGHYEVKGIPAPYKAMAIYATLSPRNVRFALADLLKEDVQYFYANDESSNREMSKQADHFFGALHRHKLAGTHFATLDLDILDSAMFKAIHDIASVLPIWMEIETSRGYHIILDVTKSSDAEAFFMQKKGHEGIEHQLRLKYAPQLEIQLDSQEPIPGTLYWRETDEPWYVRIVK